MGNRARALLVILLVAVVRGGAIPRVYCVCGKEAERRNFLASEMTARRPLRSKQVCWSSVANKPTRHNYRLLSHEERLFTVLVLVSMAM